EFIAYENLTRKPAPPRSGGRPPAPLASAPISGAFALVRRAIKILSDREVVPQTGLLKSTLLQLDSTFSERSYGASSFLDFAEKLQQAGLVLLKHAGRSVIVELNPSFSDEGIVAASRPSVEGDVATTVEGGPADGNPMLTTAPLEGGPSTFVPQAEALPRLGDNADGVREAGKILAAATSARWPMYLRNVKQILRAASFDERRYGFGGLMDLLKACQRESLLRVERDRRGGLRVFQSTGLGGESRPTPPVMVRSGEEVTDENIGNIAPPEEVRQAVIDIDIDSEVIDEPQINVVDPVAELLGRAKPKRGGKTRGTTVKGETEKPSPRATAVPRARSGGSGGRPGGPGARHGAPKGKPVGGGAGTGRKTTPATPRRGRKHDENGDPDGNR
ncbi:MAG: OST-HTH/LOTUS domain-containing protein, partial [Vicinamibacterales bacterium]